MGNLRSAFLGMLVLGWAAAACGDSPNDSSTSTSTGTGGGLSSSSGTGGEAPLTASLPQAIDGAMWANAFTYAEVPLHVAVTGKPVSVKVTLGSSSFDATDDGQSTWTAKLKIADLPDGELDVMAEATGADGTKASATATLAIGRDGRQLTVFDEVGLARSPHVVLVEEHLVVTWIDRSDSNNAKLWMRQIDGAGRFIGDRVKLVESPSSEVLWAWTAFGASSIGVLYKENGTPYKTFFKTVDKTGKELSAPVALDPPGTEGSWGGDINYDGSGFVSVWRSFDGMKNEVRWARFDEKTAMMTGPVVVAAAGSGDPVGGFDPFSFLKVRTTGNVSVVGFVREHWNALLGLGLPRSELAVLKSDGTLVSTTVLGNPSDFTWHQESRVFDIGGQLVSLRAAKDLNDPADNPEVAFYTSKIGTDGKIAAGDKGTKMFTALDAREEPHFTAHPSAFGALAWLDDRKYSANPTMGHIDLYVALVGDDLKTKEATVFEHVSFYSGLAELNGVAVGTNLPLFWIDNRHTVGVDFKPELWFETAWY